MSAEPTPLAIIPVPHVAKSNESSVVRLGKVQEHASGPQNEDTLHTLIAAELGIQERLLFKRMSTPEWEELAAIRGAASRKDDGGIDFIGSAESVKQLFRMPFSRSSVIMGIHRVGEMLLLDGNLDAITEPQPRSEPPSPPTPPATWELPTQGAAGAATDADGWVAVTGRSKSKQRKDKANTALSQTYAGAAARNHAPQGLSDARLPAGAATVADAEAAATAAADALSASGSGILALRPRRLRHGGPLPSLPTPEGPWRQFRWELQGLRMVLGTGHLVCGAPGRPHVSVKLCNEDEALSLCTCLDYFLDNVMENIPELALCMQEHGFISSCRLIRTSQIPLLGARSVPQPAAAAGAGSGSGGATNAGKSHDGGRIGGARQGAAEGAEKMFDPRAVELNAVMLLRFLQDNCSRDGGTYLLHREEGGADVQLYDLTALSLEKLKQWKWLLAMLCHRFALRIAQHARHAFPPPVSSPAPAEASARAERRRRELQERQRHLLQTSMELLVEIADMGGGLHASSGAAFDGASATIRAAVQEQIADTYLPTLLEGGAGGNNEAAASEGHSTVERARAEPLLKPKQRQKTRRKDVQKKEKTQPTTLVGARGGDLANQEAEADSEAHDICKAQDHLAGAVAILREALAAQEAAVRQLGNGSDVVILNGREPVAVMRRPTNEKRSIPSVEWRAAAMAHGRAAATGDLAAAPKHVPPKCSSESSKAAGSESTEAMEEEDEPSTALYLISKQMVNLQQKLVSTWLTVADRRLGAADAAVASDPSSPLGATPAIESAVEALVAACENLREAATTLERHITCTLQEEELLKSDDGSVSRTGKERAAQEGGLGPLWKGSLSEALERKETVSSARVDNAAAAAAAAASPATAVPTLWEDIAERQYHSQHSRLFELCGHAAHLCWTLLRCCPAGSGAGSGSSNRPEGVERLVHCLGSLLSGLAPSVSLSETDACAPVHSATTCPLLACGGWSVADVQGVALCNAALRCYDVANGLGGGGGDRQRANCRKGDVLNELAALLLQEATARISSGADGRRDPSTASATLLQAGNAASLQLKACSALLDASEHYFRRALHSFGSMEDAENLALVRLNLAAALMLRPRLARFGGCSVEHYDAAESFEAAQEQCVRAHDVLGRREGNEVIWARVSRQLGMVTLSLGVHRRLKAQPAQPPHPTVSLPGPPLTTAAEKSVVEPLERAARVFTGLGDWGQVGACHYHLGLYHARAFLSIVTENAAAAPNPLSSGGRRSASLRVAGHAQEGVQHLTVARSHFLASENGQNFLLATLALSRLLFDVSERLNLGEADEDVLRVSALEHAFCCLVDVPDAFARGEDAAKAEGVDALPCKVNWRDVRDSAALSEIAARVPVLLRALLKLYGTVQIVNGKGDGSDRVKKAALFKALYKTWLEEQNRAAADVLVLLAGQLRQGASFSKGGLHLHN